MFFLFCFFRMVDMDVKRGLVTLTNPAKKSDTPKQFTFDAVYDWK